MKGGNLFHILNHYVRLHYGQLVTTKMVQEWILLNYNKTVTSYRLGRALSRHHLFIVEVKRRDGRHYRVADSVRLWLEGLGDLL